MKSRRMLALSVTVLLVLGVAAGCKKKTQEGAANMGTTATGETTGALPPAAPPAATPAPAAPTLTDAQILKVIMVENSADSTHGSQAIRKATAPDVKAFGRKTVADHTALNKKATALAKKLNLTPAPSDLSTDLQKKANDTTQDLQGKSGADFDKAYVDEEVPYHETLVNVVEQQLIPNAQNPELKQLLEEERAGAQQHLDILKKIQSKPSA